MLSLDSLVVFFAASTVLAFTPGPDNIFVLTQSALYGRKAGIWVTLGLCSGVMVHTSAVAFGVAAVFQTSALAFTLLKVIGAAYLTYLAWKALTARPNDLNGQGDPGISFLALYRRGVIMNVTNPKVALFFLAFLPQFIDQSLGSVTQQMLVLGLVFIVSTLAVFIAVACFAGRIGEWLSSRDHAQRWINRTAAVVFVGLALRLLIAQR